MRNDWMIAGRLPNDVEKDTASVVPPGVVVLVWSAS